MNIFSGAKKMRQAEMKLFNELKYLFIFALLLAVIQFALPAEAMRIYTSTSEVSSEIKMEGIRVLPQKLSQDDKEASAYEMVKNLANSEANTRISSGFTKLSIGVVSLLLGSRIISSDQPTSGIEWAAAIYKGIGLTLGMFGLGFTGWGISDVWFHQTEIEKDYKKLSEIDSSFREVSAVEYLRVKAHEAKQERQKNDVWNLFGLIAKPETQIEKEYKEYFERHPEKSK